MQMFCNSVTELDKYDLKASPHINLKTIENQYSETQNYIQMNEAELRTFFEHICSENCL